MPAQVTLLVIFLLLWPVHSVVGTPKLLNNLVGDTLSTISDATTKSSIPAYLKPLVIAAYFIVLPFHASKLKDEAASNDAQEWFPKYVVDYDYHVLDDKEIDDVVYDRILFTEDDINAMFLADAATIHASNVFNATNVSELRKAMEDKVDCYFQMLSANDIVEHNLLMKAIGRNKDSINEIKQQIAEFKAEMLLQHQATGVINKQIQLMNDEIDKRDLFTEAKNDASLFSISELSQMDLEVYLIKQGMLEILQLLKMQTESGVASPST